MTRRYLLTQPTPADPVRPDEPFRLLWGWPEVVAATGIPRRTLERELAADRFPRPIRRVGRRPFWKPSDVSSWAGGA